MRKKFLSQMNVMLGALSLSLAGCHSTKQTVSQDDPPAKKYGPPRLEVIEEKYGIPSDLQEEPIDSVPEPTPVKYGPPVVEEEPVKCLYGVPYPRE